MDLIAALRIFLRVAEVGSFSAVAEERGVTQPACRGRSAHLKSILVRAWFNAVLMQSRSRTMDASFCRQHGNSSILPTH
jgi:hypothetical protein